VGVQLVGVQGAMSPFDRVMMGLDSVQTGCRAITNILFLFLFLFIYCIYPIVNS
jgi:hypothetical protein